MDKKKKLGNKGFSLVELIIVIAIMVILVGVLAPQYIKYLDKSKVSADTQLVDNVRQAMSTTLLDPDIKPITVTVAAQGLGEKTDANYGDYWTAVYEILGVSDANDLKTKLKLDSTNGVIKYELDGNKQIKITVSGGSYTGKNAITVPK